MPKLKLTSPGALLIFATCLAGAILLLDAFFLRPYVVAQRDAALHEAAFRALQAVREDLRNDENLLLSLCKAHSREARLVSSLTPPGSARDFETFAVDSVAATPAGLAWACDSSGKIVGVWSSVEAADSNSSPSATLQEVAKALGNAGEASGGSSGLLQIGNWVRFSIASTSHPSSFSLFLAAVRLVPKNTCARR